MVSPWMSTCVVPNGKNPTWLPQTPVHLDFILFAFQLLPKEKNSNCKNILGARAGVACLYYGLKNTGKGYNLQSDFYRMTTHSSKLG